MDHTFVDEARKGALHILSIGIQRLASGDGVFGPCLSK